MEANRSHYLNRCSELRMFLKDTDALPSYIIATQCLSVLRNILGSKWRVAYWVAKIAAGDTYGKLTRRVWEGWQRYVMRRSEDRIDQLITEYLEAIEREGS